MSLLKKHVYLNTLFERNRKGSQYEECFTIATLYVTNDLNDISCTEDIHETKFNQV